MSLIVSISPRRIAQVLTLVVLCLTLLSLAGQFAKYFFLGHDRVIWRFYVDAEGNVPAWYSSAALLLCSILLAVIASAKKIEHGRYALHWRVLSIIFLCLSLDEAFIIHETAIEPLRSALDAGGFLLYTWVVPGAAFVVIYALAYLRFLTGLPTKTRRLFLIAGLLFVAGALGMESVSGAYADLYGEENMTYGLIITIEELFEMMGIVVFIYALLAYMSSYMQEVRVRIDDEAVRSSAVVLSSAVPTHPLNGCREDESS